MHIKPITKLLTNIKKDKDYLIKKIKEWDLKYFNVKYDQGI